MPAKKRANEEWLAEQRASGQSQEEWRATNGVNLFALRDRASRLMRMDRGPQPEQSETGHLSWVAVRPEPVPEKTDGIRTADLP